MQITKEMSDSSEIRLHLTISKLKTILLVCLISFTTLLIRQTLQVQHSCSPMVHWSGELPAECQVAVNNDLDNFSSTTQISKTDIDDINYLEKPVVNDNINDLNDFDFQPKQQQSIAQKTSKSRADQITYNPPTPMLENPPHDTKTESKNLLDVIIEKVVAIKNFFWWEIKKLF